VTELRPLFESSPNPATRELLRAGRRERPPVRAVERTAAALGVAATFSASTAGASALGGTVISAAGGAPALGAMALAKWLAVGALSGTVVAGATTLARYGLEAPPARTENAAPRDAAPRTPSGVETRERGASTLRDTSPPPRASGTARPGAVLDGARRSPENPDPIQNSATWATSSAGTTSGARPTPLAVEVAAVDRARASLASGAAERALEELAEYDRLRMTGTLDREARILRIDALLRVGRRQEAVELARSYLARFPRDAHAVRLRELAGE
jgi:hypothetical protein